MELINRSHEQIIGYAYNAPFISFGKDGKIFFSRSAKAEFGIQGNLYAHFLRENKQWFVMFNNDKVGFKVCEREGVKHGGASVHSKALVEMVQKETGNTKPVRYYLQLSEKKWNKERLIEILVAKPIDKIGK